MRKEVQLTGLYSPFVANQETGSPSLLFRANSMAIKMMSVYAKMMGLKYLQSTLGDFVKEICSSDFPGTKVFKNLALSYAAEKYEVVG